MKVAGRMTLSITTCLTIIALSTNVFASSPRTAYMKLIDLWMIMCFKLTFTNVIVFCVITHMRHKVSANRKEFAKAMLDPPIQEGGPIKDRSHYGSSWTINDSGSEG